MPRARKSAAKVSSNMRRVADFGVAPTTTIFLKWRSCAAGSAHDEVSWVDAAHEVRAARHSDAMPSRVGLLRFMDFLSAPENSGECHADRSGTGGIPIRGIPVGKWRWRSRDTAAPFRAQANDSVRRHPRQPPGCESFDATHCAP